MNDPYTCAGWMVIGAFLVLIVLGIFIMFYIAGIF